MAILFNNNFEFSVQKVYKDRAGNYVFTVVKIMNKDFLIVSLYGPNPDNPEFYIELEERINETGSVKYYYRRRLEFSLKFYA